MWQEELVLNLEGLLSQTIHDNVTLERADSISSVLGCNRCEEKGDGEVTFDVFSHSYDY